ncbi:dynein regulatory complex protein 9 isoform X1 [Lepisosteus oculatus]|uniref:dynein regulatory complex protein 9 isoform X1 n=1 Tax=Lepisosteus oculatus TaxID=7918 RepID=UPI00073FC1AA|nr:PREDICTED: IQ domain-containing protein G isoform X1 [Lepisosteus oculatus]XP_015216931.1 PREDICTED: IQ domain-containing protein G isoform X1 [Lepisosteus oculatus]
MSLQSYVEQIRLCTVLEDGADQLAVLGHIMPATYEGRPDADSVLSHPQLQERAKLAQVTGALQRTQVELSRMLEHNPLTPEHLVKVQRDRQFAAQVISDVLAELQEKGTFQSLLLAVQAEKERKAHLHDIIVREEEGRRRTRALQRQLLDIRKEKELELQKREEMIAHMKDQLQEMKAKTGLEGKYVKSSAELQVYQGQKLNGHAEQQLQEQIQRLQDKIDQETRVHIEMESFLKEHQNRLEEKLEVWMERYERDIEAKQQELNLLKSNKTSNLTRLQELAKQYRECEQVVIEDRVEKEKARKQREQEETEHRAAVKIQSWWRGTLVRRGLGPFQKGKKGKGKEKGGGKKKRKKK